MQAVELTVNGISRLNLASMDTLTSRQRFQPNNSQSTISERHQVKRTEKHHEEINRAEDQDQHSQRRRQVAEIATAIARSTLDRRPAITTGTLRDEWTE